MLRRYAVILMNGCDWTIVLAMVQCSRLPEELISVLVVWLLRNVDKLLTEGADAIALEECFYKCQEVQMQYKIRLDDGNSYERELGATVRASLSKAKAFIKLCTEDKPDMSNKIVEEGQSVSNSNYLNESCQNLMEMLCSSRHSGPNLNLRLI
ncbi:chloroplastic,tRNA(Ile)-lysidine synthase [Trichinella spiralis]|uniref:Chloroplastic,tRNA(Ile)-lysidine synthase n=1 Tax=Trichinella spiralis TaxID=6334 RepID=A0ABR3KL59_TRISP